MKYLIRLKVLFLGITCALFLCVGCDKSGTTNTENLTQNTTDTKAEKRNAKDKREAISKKSAEQKAQIRKAFCECHQETISEKKDSCTAALREKFNKFRASSNKNSKKNATFEAFYASAIKKCNDVEK